MRDGGAVVVTMMMMTKKMMMKMNMLSMEMQTASTSCNARASIIGQQHAANKRVLKVVMMLPLLLLLLLLPTTDATNLAKFYCTPSPSQIVYALQLKLPQLLQQG